jgi:hypothetical protein
MIAAPKATQAKTPVGFPWVALPATPALLTFINSQRPAAGITLGRRHQLRSKFSTNIMNECRH